MLVSLISIGWVPNQLVGEVLQTGEAQAAAPTTGDPILFADQILTNKAFDAKEDKHNAGDRSDSMNL